MGANDGPAAASAAAAFAGGRYGEALGLLERLRDKQPTDPKVLHNLAVVEYQQSGQASPRELIEKLCSLRTLVEQQAATQAEECGAAACSPPGSGGAAASSPPGSGAASSSPRYAPRSPSHPAAPGTPPAVAAADARPPPLLSTADTYPLDLNMAALHAQLGQYGPAIGLLEPLFRAVESLDNDAALRCCLLLLDCHLQVADDGKAAEVLLLMEQMYGSPAAASARSASARSASPSRAGDMSGGKPQVGLPPRSAIAPAAEVQLALRLARARVFLLRREKRRAEQAIMEALLISPADPEAIGLSMQLNFTTGQLYLAAQQLGRQLAGGVAPSRPLALANLGLLHHCLAKHHTALMYLSAALAGAAGEERPGGPGRPTVAQLAAMRHTAGLQLLLTKQHAAAHAMFQQVAVVHYQSPHLWLRLAECCLGELSRGSAQRAGRVEVVVAEADQRLQTGYLLPAGAHPWLPQDGGAPATSAPSPLSAAAALRYLRNALFLLRQMEAAGGHWDAGRERPATGGGAPSAQARRVGQQGAAGASKKPPGLKVEGLAEGTPVLGAPLVTRAIKEKEGRELTLAVLTNLAYVHLLNHNPVQALAEAKHALAARGCRPAHRYAAHCYAAEALCMLGRPGEAAEAVGLAMAEQQRAEGGAGAEEEDVEETGNSPASTCLPAVPRSAAAATASFLASAEAKAALHVNLASVHAMRGDLRTARECAERALHHLPDFQPAQLMMVYLHLRGGATAEALGLLKTIPAAVVHAEPCA
eukprot:jgi/Tetstr1/461635/TSEL_006735.t1